MSQLVNPEAENVAAFFDMDRTLLNVSSGRLYMQALIKMGRVTALERLQMLWWALMYVLGRLDMAAMLVTLLNRYHAGESVEETWDLTMRWFNEMVRPHISAVGRARVEEHRARGHRVVLISASTEFATGALGRYLNMDVLATRLGVRDGRLTGEIVHPFCYGEGKVYWAQQYAREHGIDLSRSWFYTDSASDLPLLERVGHPVAVNPDRRLQVVARERSWPVEYWHGPKANATEKGG